MASFSSGQTGGNEQEAENVLRGSGIQNPSSGLVRYVAHGATDYSYEEATKYGLPITSGMLAGERQKAIQPAIETLEAGRPKLEERYDIRTQQLEAERDPLKERYQTLIDELGRRETKETERTGKYMAQEFGAKRGIPLSSGMYQQALGEGLSDVERFYGTQRKETGLAQEADLRDLRNAIQNVEQERIATLQELDQTIANLKAGAGNQAITDAMQLYRDEQARKFDSRFDDLTRQLKEYEVKTAKETSETAQIFRQLGNLESQFGGISF